MNAQAPNKASQETDHDAAAEIRRMANYIRLLEFLVATIAVGAGIHSEVFPYDGYLILLALLLAYPLVAQTIAARMERKGQKQEQVSRVLIQLDAGLIGLSLAALQFSLVPCLALLIIVHANAVTAGGVYIWAMTVLWTLMGAIAGSFLFGFQIMQVTETPFLMMVLPMLGLGAYVGASAVFSLQQTRYLRETQLQFAQQQKQAVELSRKLAKYLSPQIWGSLFSGKRDAKVETRRKKLTVFFSDIKGFSAMSEELPLETLTSMLNTYLSDMTRIAMRYGGTVDKFIGDAVMVFFGDPTSKGSKEDATACVMMAIEMQKHMKLLRQKWKRQGITQKLEIRIGVNTGYVTVGNFGTETRLDYTILGTDVNLASRLESSCRPGHILISEQTHQLVNDRILCRNMGDIQVKGFNRPIPVFEVVEARSKAGKGKDFMSAETAGFSIYLQVERIRNFDKKPILQALARSATGLKQKQPVSTDYEADGFSLHVDSEKVKAKEIPLIVETMGKAARHVQEKVKM